MLQFLPAIKAAAVGVVAYFAPIAPLVLLVGIVLGLDTITGMWASQEKITSKRMREGVIRKMFIYQVVILSFFLVDTFVLAGSFTFLAAHPLALTKIVAAAIVLVEVLSINENFEVLYGVDVIKKGKESLLSIKEFFTTMKK